jgi:hypothetical protein
MNEVYFDVNSFVIAAILLIAALLALYVGFWSGRKRESIYTNSMKSQIASIQSSFLGLFSFLLAFSFGIALHHFDNRNEAMKDEANAIGTTYLRAHALPDLVRLETLSTLQKYVDVRVQAGSIALHSISQREVLLQEASSLRTDLWALAMKSLKADDRVTTTGLYIQTLNDLIDSFGTRDEVLNRSIPEVVIFSLMIALVFWAGSVGYVSAISGIKPTWAAVGYMTAAILLISLVVDMDRPRRGLIQVSQKNMLELQAEIRRSQ